MSKIYDIVVVGGGPAGLTAAIYGLRNGKTVLVIEKDVFGGQIVNSPKVVNIPGFNEISGDEYGDLLLNQARNQGAEVMFDKVERIDEGDILTINVELGEPIQSKTVIIANGTKHRKLNLPHEDNLIGKGVHFCAVCDGNFYQGKTVVMVGGGNSAFVEGNMLADLASKLIMLQDMPIFTADKALQEDLFKKTNVEKHVNCKVKEYLLKDNKLCGVKYEENGVENTIECDGVFLAIGLIPDNKPFQNVAEIDEMGYFITNELGHTKTKNVFVAGDNRQKSLRQVATACSDGANAAIEACNFLK